MALTDQEKEIVKSTVPLLRTGGDTLTSHFYAKMMDTHPEVRKFFNQTHQKDGSQARALARAVLAYAENIDRLENLGSVAPGIVQKHVALDIHAEHYPIVGECLIASMPEVLGRDIATDEVLNAWTKAYNQLADILIGIENKNYDEIEHTTGGWSGFRKFVVARKTQETPMATSFWLEPQDGGPVLPSKPGQYITVKAELNGQEARRNYSVSSAPGTKGYRITVKNIGAMSSHLHSLQEGSVIDVRPPCGVFVLSPEAKEIILIAGGIGITPLAAMALSGQVKAKLLYYAHEDERALLEELQKLPNVEVVEVGRRPTAEEIEALGTDTPIYLTGPIDFMKSVIGLTKSGAPVNFEFFGSTQF